MSRRYALLDRDGTILTKHHYLSRVEDVALLPGAGAALRRLQRLGFGLIVITNQSGIGRGLVTLEQLAQIHARMLQLLEAAHVAVEAVYFCPHLPEEGCACRKPAPLLAYEAARRFGFALEESLVIGDNACDVEFGRQIGAFSVLVRTGEGHRVCGEGAVAPDLVAANLADAVAQLGRRLHHGAGVR